MGMVGHSRVSAKVLGPGHAPGRQLRRLRHDALTQSRLPSSNLSLPKQRYHNSPCLLLKSSSVILKTSYPHLKAAILRGTFYRFFRGRDSIKWYEESRRLYFGTANPVTGVKTCLTPVK